MIIVNQIYENSLFLVFNSIDYIFGNNKIKPTKNMSTLIMIII